MPERFFISRVALRNFKSIRQCDVRLGQLTFLVGLNGSGKSNLVEAIRFLSLALNASLESALVIGGGLWGILRRGSAHEIRIGFEIDFEVGSETTGSYELEIEPSVRGSAVVAHEKCVIRSHGVEHWFQVKHGRVESNQAVAPVVSEEKLYLINASGLSPFEAVYRALSDFQVYNPVPAEIRAIRPEKDFRILDRTGSALAAAVSRMQKFAPGRWKRVNEYLQTIASSITNVAAQDIPGGGSLLLFDSKTEGGTTTTFQAMSMSDGTLRALAILVALFQYDDRQALSLIGLEEPEAGLHPAAASVLFDALMEASRLSQVIVTSHSPDLLDRNDIPEDALKAVVMANGETFIGEVDAVGKKAMKEHLYTAGELLRMDQLRPEGLPEFAASGKALLFGFVVEGNGEMEAVPLLVRRLAPWVGTTKPVKMQKSKTLKAGELERAVRLAFLNNGFNGPVMVILDADKDCPASLGPRLKEKALTVAQGQEVSIVIAKCEFEAWFIGAAESLAGKCGLRQDLKAPPDPEGIRGAKEWLERNMPQNRRYSETVDQAKLVAAMNLDAARRCRSFDRFRREIERLIR